MASESDTTAGAPPPSPSNTAWHTLSMPDVSQRLEVDPHMGLNTGEARRRLQQHGHNTIPKHRQRSLTRIFVDQFTDFMKEEDWDYTLWVICWKKISDRFAWASACSMVIPRSCTFFIKVSQNAFIDIFALRHVVIPKFDIGVSVSEKYFTFIAVS
jgi:magnesium-transporting ATPase (P-type)